MDEEVQQRVHDLSHRLEAQRITVEQFLSATGQTGDELVAQVRQEAFRAVKADLALRAVADAEGLEVSDEELDAEIAAMAARMDTDPAALRRQIDRNGRTLAVRSEQRKAKALTWLLEHVEAVDEEGAPVPTQDLLTEGAEGAERPEEPTGADTIDATEGGPE